MADPDLGRQALEFLLGPQGAFTVTGLIILMGLFISMRYITRVGGVKSVKLLVKPGSRQTDDDQVPTSPNVVDKKRRKYA